MARRQRGMRVELFVGCLTLVLGAGILAGFVMAAALARRWLRQWERAGKS